MNSKRILAYGEDALVISTRAMILQRAGYDVSHTTRIIDVLPLLRGISFDLLLIGDSIRTPQNVQLAQSVREQFPALVIAMVQDEKEDRDPWSTAFISSNPEQMLTSLDLLFDDHRKPVASDRDLRNFKVMHSAAGR